MVLCLQAFPIKILLHRTGRCLKQSTAPKPPLQIKHMSLQMERRTRQFRLNASTFRCSNVLINVSFLRGKLESTTVARQWFQRNYRNRKIRCYVKQRFRHWRQQIQSNSTKFKKKSSYLSPKWTYR